MKMIKARAGIEAQYGLNDVYPGDDYPVRELFDRPAFMTAVSGDGDPYIKISFKTLAEMQEFHRLLAAALAPSTGAQDSASQAEA